MNNRGRPRTPDVLTPREYEVLALLRDGLSNREIAERLGISLAGAKFHVSEIIGKLGVESREAAAAWDAQPRRWGFAPFTLFSSWSGSVSALLTPKVAAASLGAAVLAGLAAGVVITEGGGRGGGPGKALAVTVPATPTPELPAICEQVVCSTSSQVRTEVTSLEEAAALATFPPRLPSYIPDGFNERTLLHSRPGTMTTYLQDGSKDERPFAGDPYYDKLWATYLSNDGRLLSVQQGYYDVAPTGWYEMAPEGMKGSLDLAGKELRWVRGGPKPTTEWVLNEHGARPIQEGWEDGGLILYWTMSSLEVDAWEITPDGERRTVTRPLEYAVGSNTLPLDELLKVAKSVLQSP